MTVTANRAQSLSISPGSARKHLEGEGGWLPRMRQDEMGAENNCKVRGKDAMAVTCVAPQPRRWARKDKRCTPNSATSFRSPRTKQVIAHSAPPSDTDKARDHRPSREPSAIDQDQHPPEQTATPPASIYFPLTGTRRRE